MTISRWKMMACTLGLTVGGLALVAGHSDNKVNAQWEIKEAKPRPQTTAPAPVFPVSNKPAPVPEAPPLITVPVPPQDFIIPTPIVPVQAVQATGAIELELIPDAPMTSPEKLPMPREVKAVEAVTDRVFVDPQFDAPPPAAKVPSSPLVEPAPIDFAVPPPPLAPKAPTVIAPNPPMVAPPEPQAPIAPPVFVQPVPTPAPQVAPAPIAPPAIVQPVPASAPRVDLPPPAPIAPVAVKPMPTPPQAVQPWTPPVSHQPYGEPTQAVPASKLKMLLRLGDGKPRFEIRSSDSTDLLFKVYGEKVEMQSAPDGVKNSPIAGVTAVGKVRFVGAGIEGTCDSLSILSGTGEVLLKGNVHMKTKRGKAWSEMTAEKLIYQIGATGLTTPVSKPAVTPATYQENR